MPLKIDEPLRPAQTAQPQTRPKSPRTRKKADNGKVNGSLVSVTPEVVEPSKQDSPAMSILAMKQANDAYLQSNPSKRKTYNGVDAGNGMGYVRRLHPDLIALEELRWKSLEFVKEVWPTLHLRTWQECILEAIDDGLALDDAIYRLAVASGKGAGKTRLIALLYHWQLATRRDSKVVLTATTGRQISDRAWTEVQAMLYLSPLLKEHFKIQSQRCINRDDDTWYGVNQTWNINSPESFQGFHAKHLCFLVDEASAVPDNILNTIESGLTDEHCFMGVFSNPTRMTGFFRRCFPGGNASHLWNHYQIDTRQVEGVNQDRLQEQLDKAQGDEDDMLFRINVRGQFPQANNAQFISEELITLARERVYEVDDGAPYLIGVDVARFGANKSVILVRHGAKILEKRVYRGRDTQDIAGYVCEVADVYQRFRPTIFIEGAGVGAGVVDTCSKRGYRVQEVEPAGKARDARQYANKRAEMYGDLREALRTFLCLDLDEELTGQLIEITYGYDVSNRLLLESKQDMEARSMASPDDADALALTFAERVARRDARSMHPMIADGVPSGHWYTWYTG